MKSNLSDAHSVNDVFEAQLIEKREVGKISILYISQITEPFQFLLE